MPTLRIAPATGADPGTPHEVTTAETFFDLVYVFAISQLASHLADNLTWRGAAQTLLLLVAVFTIWSFTTFESTMVLARSRPARWVILGVMVFGLVMNASITEAFSSSPWSFVVPMVIIQVGRSAVTSRLDVLPVLRRHRFAMTVWAVFSAVPWVLGALATNPDRRLLWWLLAVVIDLVGALTRHPVPGFAQEGLESIRFDVPHQVERCRLFLLICLGEAIVRAGVGLARDPQGLAHLAAGVASMLSLIAVWVIFFGSAQEQVDGWFQQSGRLTASEKGRLATYGQQVLVVAFVAYAVGTEMSVGEPLEPLGAKGTALLFGGMALCLASYAAFLASLTGRRAPLPLVAGALVVLAAAAVSSLLHLPALAASGLLTVLMAVVAGTQQRLAPALLAPDPLEGRP